MKKSIYSVLLVFLGLFQVNGQAGLLTVAEKSGFKSTSNYGDVMQFVEELNKSSKYVRAETIARSVEGRDVPLLIIGNPVPKSPQQLAGDSRVVIYIQANIHAGEVEGKEAVLMFARDLLSEKNPELLKNVVFLLCPNFNPDGNEKISTLNRNDQNGPVNGVGVRHNGQFLDLNRDGMKAESPEVRGLITNVFTKWDPAVFMDCHTTNGSFHVEPVTFTWMVNPNGDKSLIRYMQEKMMPLISRTLLEKYNVQNCYYGEFKDLLKPEEGWFYEVSEPRYMTNYFGLRNRLAILNENYIYADYESRVRGCYGLIRSLAEYASANAAEIRKMLFEADSRTINRGLDPSPADSFAIEFEAKPLPDKVTIKTFEAEAFTDANGRRRTRPTDRQVDVTVPYYVDYHSTRNVRFPFAYLVTTHDPQIVGLLKTHGIRIENLAVDSDILVEKFEITDLKGAARLNQGHYINSVQGNPVTGTVTFPAGTIVIRTSQKLANLAAYLLEPQSKDGLLTWNFLDRYLVPQWGMGFNPFPIYKVLDKTNLRTIAVSD